MLLARGLGTVAPVIPRIVASHSKGIGGSAFSGSPGCRCRIKEQYNASPGHEKGILQAPVVLPHTPQRHRISESVHPETELLALNELGPRPTRRAPRLPGAQLLHSALGQEWHRLALSQPEGVHTCKPHSVLPVPAQRPSRGWWPSGTGTVVGAHPIDTYPT